MLITTFTMELSHPDKAPSYIVHVIAPDKRKILLMGIFFHVKKLTEMNFHIKKG